jgi:ABC-type Fe3+-hydroxamate transport system substrate-binding protein
VRRLFILALVSGVAFSACGSASKTAESVKTIGSTPPPASAQTDTPAPASRPSPAHSLAAADAGWVVVAPTGYGFTSRFPAAPKLTQTTTTTKLGAVPTFNWEYLANTNLDYNVVMWQYPAGTLAADGTPVVFDGAINGMESSNGLTLDGQSDTTLKGHPARTFALSKDTYSMAGVLVLVGDHLYMAFGTYAPTIDPAGVAAFVADFQVTA